MPLQVKKVQLKVKDGNQYVDGDMLFNVDAEAWARGKRNGQTVSSTDPTYHNNAEYFAQQAATSAATANQIVFTGNLAPSYSSSAAYQIGDYVVYNNALYECTTAIPSPGEAFNVSHWQAVMVSDIKEQVDNIIVVNEQAQPETKVQIETTDEDVDIALMSDIPDLSNIIAEEFTTNKVYAIGQYVLYNDNLYKFTSAHSAGAWNSSQVTQVKIGDEVTNINDQVDDLKTQLSKVYSSKPLDIWEVGAYAVSTGNKNNSAPKRIRTKIDSPISADGCDKIVATNGYLMYVMRWDADENGEYNGALQTDGTYAKSSTNLAWVSELDISNDTTHVYRLVARNPDLSDMDAAEGQNILFYAITTDETLSKWHVPADAKATGDAITVAKTSIKALIQPVGRITWNGTASANVISIDTTNRTITFGSSAFLTYMNTRYSLGNKSCTYPESGSTMVCYYNIANSTINAVSHSSFNPDENIILFDFIRTNWGVDANTLCVNYSVDGVSYACKEKAQEIIYIAPNGNDSNFGTKSSPLATLGAAISRGAKNICLTNGEYRISAAMEFSNLLNISIFADDTDTYPSPAIPRERPTFIGGDDYTSFTTEDDGTRSFIPSSIPGRYTRVFIDHDLDPMTSGTRPSPNACLWIHYANRTADKKMTPVLSTTDLLAGTDVFYYDGTKVYINAADATYISATVGFDYTGILKFSACNNISITGINFKYGGNSNLILLNCNNVTVKNCKSEYTSFSDGVSTNFSETTFINCESFMARNDGFNCHYYGVSHYVDCHSHYNGDDGESSHEYCVVEVNGGEYDHNGKGGHSPVNGCKFYDNGSYSHHNTYGFYCVAQGSESTTYIVESMLIMNAVAVNNTTDILANRAEVIAGNTKYGTHSEVNGGTLMDLNNQ